MKKLEFKNIKVNKFDGLYPDYLIVSAYWKDTGEPLTEIELDNLNEDYELVYELIIDFVQ